MKKIITLAVCLLIYSSALSFEENSDNGEKAVIVEHGHWYKGEVIKKLNYDSLWNESVDLNSSPEGSKVLNNCLEAYGGLEHINTLKNLEIEYNLQSLLNDENKFIVKQFSSNDLKYKKITPGEDSTISLSILNGNKASKSVNKTSMLIYDIDYKYILSNYLVMSMPANINKETFSEIKYGTRSDDSLAYIYLKKEDTLMMILGIDPTDNFIKKIEGILLQNESRTVFINYFSDFKEYNGYILPSMRMYVSMGLKISEYSIISVKINQELAEDTFNVIDSKKESILR